MRFLRAAINRSVPHQYQKGPKARPSVHVLGRPRVGDFRLQTILPIKVLDELLRAENETDVYRTRIAANVLCEWAERQASRRV